MASTDLIRCFHPADRSAARALCLPHAGGSASFFFALSRSLSPEVEVLAAQYPGRQDRRHEAPLTDLGSLADQVVSGLDDFLDRDLIVFGHSLGATLGFEVVRRLERVGVAVRHLIVSGRRAPSCPADGGLHTLLDDALIAEMRALAGDELPLPDDEMLQIALPAVRADYCAVETYRYDGGPPIGCPVTAIYGENDPRVTPAMVSRWAEHTVGGFRTVVVPGAHFYLAGQVDTVRSLVRAVATEPAGDSPRAEVPAIRIDEGDT
ncbi:thioesterase II family protein [uncultured Pseudonocardia sp.]|uniref:thioesterase II family protein n=1 Tax=uncultured Pseudonocardia sp. TaxID=211455 RepID=UPI002621BE67|nr:alpha/beta fold hydrolase [uncultured Pseudonocardia sp.]